jgi:hypothetical protein
MKNFLPYLSIKGAIRGRQPREVIPMDPMTRPTSILFPPSSTMITGKKLQVATTRNKQKFAAAINRN